MSLWKNLWNMWITSVYIIILQLVKNGIMSTIVLSANPWKENRIFLQEIL